MPVFGGVGARVGWLGLVRFRARARVRGGGEVGRGGLLERVRVCGWHGRRERADDAAVDSEWGEEGRIRFWLKQCHCRMKSSTTSRFAFNSQGSLALESSA